MTTTERWEIKFDKKFGNNLEINEGMTALSVEEYHSSATKKVKSFIRSLLEQARQEELEKVRDTLVKTAIEGAKDDDNVKGLYLYARMLTRIDELLEEDSK